MVKFNKEIFIDAVSNYNISAEINESSISKVLEEYPAFNTAYLLEANVLNYKNKELFNKNLPKIATHIIDRSVLHDMVNENISFQIIEKEVKEKPVSVEPPKKADKKEAKKTKATSNAIDKKEENRLLAMKKLQDELFKSKTKSGEKVDAKEQKRLDAMKNLQNELFEAKTNNKTSSAPAKEDSSKKEKISLEKTKKELLEKQKIQKEDFAKIEKEKAEIIAQKKELDVRIATLKKLQDGPFTPKSSNKSKKIQEEIAEKNKAFIDSLKDSQQQKVEKILDSDSSSLKVDSTFEEIQEKIDKKKTPIVESKVEKEKNISNPNQLSKEQIALKKKDPLSFLRWLKNKDSDQDVQEITSPISKKKEEPIFEQVSPIEAEMHQEAKASSDPLDNFISTQISKKRKVKAKKDDQLNTIVSETLAEILTLQLKYNEAIEVYTLLSLKYPQKSIYFARQIEKIKNFI